MSEKSPSGPMMTAIWWAEDRSSDLRGDAEGSRLPVMMMS